jgi:hypothetical protein
MDPIKGTLICVLGIVFVVVIVLVCVYYIVKAVASAKSVPDASWQNSSAFRDSIKSSGLETEKVISYGKTFFTYDEIGKKIIIQTANMPEKMMIDSGDVISAVIIRDGRAAEPEAAGAEPDFQGVRRTETSCSDLHITIAKKDGTEIILPLIDSPTQYEYTYRRALEVASEIIAVLRDIRPK